jgi:hypothetical protein
MDCPYAAVFFVSELVYCPHKLAGTDECYNTAIYFQEQKADKYLCRWKKISEVHLSVNTRKSMLDEELDMEWIDLIATAQLMGIPLEDVRQFLKESGNSDSSDSKVRFV